MTRCNTITSVVAMSLNARPLKARLRTAFSLTAVSLAAIPLTAMPLLAQASGSAPKQSIVMLGKAPVSSKVLDVKLPKAKTGDLPNGLHLIVLEDHRLPRVTFQVIIPGAGGYFDATGAAGVAGITATMMREGTPTRNTTQISEQLEAIAAGFSVGAGASSLDATVNGTALTAKFPAVFDLATDVLLHPTFPESELGKYKQRTAAQLTQQRANAGFLSAELYYKVMNGDHPASRISVTPDQVKAVTREQLVAFHKAHYIPDHAAIAFAGDITYEQAKQLVESKLGAWKKTGAAPVVAVSPSLPAQARVHLVDRPNSVQTSFYVGVPAIERTDKDYDIMQALNGVLGGGPTGRLFSHLREEKGYTYGAYSQLEAGRYRGVLTASTDVRTEVTEPALTDLMDEIRQMRDVRVSDKELLDKKRSQVASFALSLESPQQMLGYYVTQWIYKLPADYWDTYPKRVMAVTSEQVQAAAKKYLDPSRVQIVAVGEGQKIEAILRKFGPLDVYDVEGKKKPTIVP